MNAKEKARIRSRALRCVNKARRAMGKGALSRLPAGARQDAYSCPIAKALSGRGAGPRFRVSSVSLAFRWASPSDDEQERLIGTGNAEIRKIAKAWGLSTHREATAFYVKPLYLRMPDAIGKFVIFHDEGVI